MIKCIIVDDEPLALDVLETYISRIDNLELVARCNNAIDALAALHNGDIDLMFLDIQMPQLTGIELVKKLEHPPCIVFTTAYSNYAMEGYELNVTDYLLKPISFERFQVAVQKAAEQIQLRTPTEEISEDHIYVKSDKKLVKVKFDDIYFIEGLKDYVIIRMKQGRIITLQTMKSLEEKLPPEMFHRIHRSYIVSMEHIEALDGNMVEINKQQIPIGKNYRDELLERINKNKL